MQTGRKEIFTDVKSITSENIIDVLQKAMTDFGNVADDCRTLINYEKGIQPIIRKKKYRSDIDCKCVDNVANEVTDFKLGFQWANPTTFVQRREEHGGALNAAEAISLLNEQYDIAGIKKNTQKLGYYVETTGVGYVLIDINSNDAWEEGDSYFTYDVLDNTCTFIVKSSLYLDHRPMLGVTFRKDSSGNRFFTCFTADKRYEIYNLTKIIENGSEREAEKWGETKYSGAKNPLGIIPIVEYIRSHDRMGCFERQISEMNNLNLLISDFTNDVEQNTQAIWHTNDVEFPKNIIKNADGTTHEETVRPEANDWLQTYTTPDGKTPTIKPLSIDYDYEGMLNNIITRRSLILQKCNVPCRNEDSGGSTGIAMDRATGWDAAEAAASKQQSIIDDSKMKELKVVLRAIRKHSGVPADSPLLKLKFSDMRPNTNRQKNYELTTKINFFATGVSHGLNGLHLLKTMNAFDDVNQVWEDSKDTIEKYQKSIFDSTTKSNPVGGAGEQAPNSDRLSADYSDQVSNSPNIHG